jgi:uncharacterized protein YukE
MPSSQMRYDHGMIADHTVAQKALKASLEDDLAQTMAVLEDSRAFWQGHGSNNYEVFHREVSRLFTGVFGDIEQHAIQQNLASQAAQNADHASAASLSM